MITVMFAAGSIFTLLFVSLIFAALRNEIRPIHFGPWEDEANSGF